MPKKLPVQPMTSRQIDNLINKYNKRAEAAAKALGTKSTLYQDYTTLISMLTGGNTRTKSIKTATGKTEKIIQATENSEPPSKAENSSGVFTRYQRNTLQRNI